MYCIIIKYILYLTKYANKKNERFEIRRKKEKKNLRWAETAHCPTTLPLGFSATTV